MMEDDDIKAAKQTEKNKKVFDRAFKQFNDIEYEQRPHRKAALADRRFYSVDGAQWEDNLGKQFESKPKVSINKISRSVDDIFAGYYEHKVDVKFLPTDGSDGSIDDIASLYRADQHDSHAEEAHDTAFEEGSTGGFGAFILRNGYEDKYSDNEYQRIRFEPIHDADQRVYFAPESKMRDKSDAPYAYLLHYLPREVYKAKYNDDPADWPRQTNREHYTWFHKDTVTIAEYFEQEDKTDTYHVYQPITGDQEGEITYSTDDFEDDDNLETALAAQGMTRVREYEKTRKRVRRYIMSGSKVLKDCGYIAGEHIPIIPYFGGRTVVGNIEYFAGHVRVAKDAQRVLNAQVSHLLHTASLSPVEKPIFTPEQVKGHELRWAEDNVKNKPFMLVNTIKDANNNPIPAPPLAYTKPPVVPPSLAALLQLTDGYMADLLGSEENPADISRNVSGVAVEMMHGRLDRRTFKYLYNFGVAVKRSGQVWTSMGREIYTEQDRYMKSVDDKGGVGRVKINAPGIDKKGNSRTRNNMKDARFDVTVTVGPGSASKRSATARTLSELLPLAQDPQTRQMIIMSIFMNLEGEGVEDIRNFSRKQLVAMGVTPPTEEEKREMQQAQEQQQPDPNAEYLKAEAAKARADTILTVAKASNTEVDSEKKEAEIRKLAAETQAINENDSNNHLRKGDNMQ